MKYYNRTIFTSMEMRHFCIYILSRLNLVALLQGCALRPWAWSTEMSQQIFVEHYNLSVFQITGNGIFLYLYSTSAKFSFSNARVSFEALGV